MNSDFSIEQITIDGNHVQGRVRFYRDEPCTLQELWLAVVQKPEEGGRSYWGTQKLSLGYDSDTATGWLFPFSFDVEPPEGQLPLGELRLPVDEQSERQKDRNMMAMAAGPFFFEAMLMTDMDERAILSEKVNFGSEPY